MNDKGAEWDQSNNIQFKNFLIFDHYTAGIDTKSIMFNKLLNTQYSKYFYNSINGPSILNSVIIGNSNSNATSSLTPKGLIIAWDRGQLISNVTLANFPDANSYAIGATEIAGACL